MTRTERIWSSQIAFKHMGDGAPPPRIGGGLQGFDRANMRVWMSKTAQISLEIMMNPIANSSSTSVIAGTEHGGGSDPDALLLGSEHLRWCIFPAEVAAAIESGTDLCPSAAGPSMMMAPQPQSKEVKHAEAIELQDTCWMAVPTCRQGHFTQKAPY